MLHKASGDADVVFLGLALPQAEEETAAAQRLSQRRTLHREHSMTHTSPPSGSRVSFCPRMWSRSSSVGLRKVESPSRIRRGGIGVLPRWCGNDERARCQGPVQSLPIRRVAGETRREDVPVIAMASHISATRPKADCTDCESAGEPLPRPRAQRVSGYLDATLTPRTAIEGESTLPANHPGSFPSPIRWSFSRS